MEVGNQVQAGQPLLAIVPLEGTWITANYKETQLEKGEAGPEGIDQGGHLSGQDVHGKGRQHHGRHRVGVRPFPP